MKTTSGNIKPKKAGARIALRLSQEELDRLDVKVKRMQKEMPSFTVTRSAAVRIAVAEFSKRP